MIKKAGFGGGCHWCTEAVFSTLKGVTQVRQGWISTSVAPTDFSEGVLLSFDSDIIDLATLIEIHLYTHASRSNHSMRGKYRSGIYVFEESDRRESEQILSRLQLDFDKPIVTKVYAFGEFTMSRESLLDYYFSDPTKPFCELYINPKLKLLMAKFSESVQTEKVSHLSGI